MIGRPFTQIIAATLLLFVLLEESRAWTTRSALLSRSNAERQQLSPPKRTPIAHGLSIASNGDDLESVDCDSIDEGLAVAGSRRRWLGSIGATAASAVGLSIALSPLPSHAAATLVSSKSVCDPTVSVWSKNGRIIYLLGTAHISSISAELAGNLVKETNPKGVFIELDPKRVSGEGMLAKKFKGDETTPAPVRESKIIVPQISEFAGDGGLVLASGPPSNNGALLPAAAAKPSPPKKANINPVMAAATAVVGKQLKGLYSRLDSAGFDSGDEFVRAVREGQKVGADIVLGDRDVEVTMRRLTEGLTKTDLKALFSSDSELEKTLEGMVPFDAALGERLAGSSSSSSGEQELSDAQFKEQLTTIMEVMKKKDNVKKIMAQLQRIAPFLYEALVGERDVYMATGLNGLNELETIVAVVGMAHADGIESTLQQNGWKAANPMCSK
eukprot:CAMPEP_0194133704 /NCGR_PEP_ID=MMETSP0152-20130528/3759_1 /TAXON_ID=1049557 /ORGANISM="Thalassiothrix antarctica, Strain L6-D1" /LENGTH=442 /DNA_ID=CAMNT_0038829051 /DNA_START=86 /DNA_END=1414 /DNA_ORIENTATION=-